MMPEDRCDDCGGPKADPRHDNVLNPTNAHHVFVRNTKQLDGSRYAFGAVKGVMRDATTWSMGAESLVRQPYIEQHAVAIEFDYLDQRDGLTYHVSATGFRTLKSPKEPDAQSTVR